MTEFERPVYDPAMFAPPPARDGRFKVVEQWVDCHNFPEGDPRREIEFFHRQMSEEVDGMECSARTLVDFPQADWELRMCLARQCYDEARHVEMFRRIFEERGGKVGQYPIMNFQYRIITNVADLYRRLAIQNRHFESEGVDAVEPAILAARAGGDHGLAELFDAQLADEICHVRFANDHISRIASREPGSVMRIGRSLDYASKAFYQVMGQKAIDAVSYSVNEAGRLESGFTADEVRFIATHRAARPNSKAVDPA